MLHETFKERNIAYHIAYEELVAVMQHEGTDAGKREEEEGGKLM